MNLGVGSVYSGKSFCDINIFNGEVNDDPINLDSLSDDLPGLDSLNNSPGSDVLSDSSGSDSLEASLEVSKDDQEHRGNISPVSLTKGSHSPCVLKRRVPCTTNREEQIDCFVDFDLGLSPSPTFKRHCPTATTTKRIASSRSLISFFSASSSSISSASASTIYTPALPESIVGSRSEPRSSSSSTLPRCSSLPSVQNPNIPKPSDAGFDGRRVKARFVPPPPPCKKPISRAFMIPGVVDRVKELYDKYTSIIHRLLNNSLNYLGENFIVELIEGAKGVYKQAFTVCPGQSDIIPGLSNDLILIKAYHENCLEKDHEKILQMNQNAISQYQQCLGNGIPVAKIYNIDPETNSLIGDVFIMQKINYAVDIEQWAIQCDNTDPLQSKRPVDFPELVSMKKIFNRAIEKLLNLDLNPGNFRYDDHQTKEVVLVDFREVEDVLPGDNKEDAFKFYETIGNIFKDVNDCASDRLEVWNYLTSDFIRLNTHPVIADRIEKERQKHEAIENSIKQYDQF